MTTRKKLEGNGLWESSRMMLPEHKATIIRRQLEEGRKDKPNLDPQEMELIERMLAESFHECRTISLQLYDEYEDVELTGVVTTVLTQRREIKLAVGPGEWEWIKIDEIVSVK